jgi:hypothetical protein
MSDKITTSIIVLLLVVAFASYYIYTKSAKVVEKPSADIFATSTLPTPTPKTAAELIREKETPPEGFCYSDAVITQLPVHTDQAEVWTTYHNTEYGYTLSYPDTGCLYVDNVNNSIDVTDGAQGPSFIDVSATATTETLDVWLENQKRAGTQLSDTTVIGRKLTVAGYDAVVTHDSNVDGRPYEETPSAQQTVFVLKDGVMFGIWTRGIASEEVLKRFTFDK